MVKITHFSTPSAKDNSHNRPRQPHLMKYAPLSEWLAQAYRSESGGYSRYALYIPLLKIPQWEHLDASALHHRPPASATLQTAFSKPVSLKQRQTIPITRRIVILGAKIQIITQPLKIITTLLTGQSPAINNRQKRSFKFS